jgi:micrococcal nuclease
MNPVVPITDDANVIMPSSSVPKDPIPFPRETASYPFWERKRYSNRRIISAKPGICPHVSSASTNTKITWENTKPFVPPITEGIVIKVYDGDTITIATQLPMENSPMYRFSVRLLGIDSAEIKGKTEAEKHIATLAKEALSTKILGNKVTLRNISLEKYGRVLADVYLEDLHLNQWMLDNGYAVSYDGGTKHRPAEWNQ